MTPKRRKRLSPTQKQTRAFLKQRISFHIQGFEAAKKAGQQTTELRNKTEIPERKKLLSKAANDLGSLANWHLHRGQKLRKSKARHFPSPKNSKEKN